MNSEYAERVSILALKPRPFIEQCRPSVCRLHDFLFKLASELHIPYRSTGGRRHDPATNSSDRQKLLELTARTGLFTQYDIDTLDGVLEDYLDPDSTENVNHVCVTCEFNGGAVGYIYYAETEYADRVWFVWWVAVDKATQGQGVGRDLLRYAEEDVRQRGGRLMFIETSGQPGYEPTRRFYERNGYDRRRCCGITIGTATTKWCSAND